MRNALRGGRVGVVGDDHPRGLAVRGEEERESALELGVVEHLRRHVEGAVILGLVECLPHRVGVLQRLGGLFRESGLGGAVGLGQLLVALLDGDLFRNQRQQLRLQRIEPFKACGDLVELAAEVIDPVEGVEERAERCAERNVEAVRLPVEVVADRPEEVVDVGDLVAEILDGLGGLPERRHLLVGGRRGLLLQVVLLLQQGDRPRDLRDLLEQVVGAGLLEGQVLDLGGTLCAHLESERRVVQGSAQRPGDGLHHGHTGGAEDLLGDPLQHDHVGRGSQILVGLDHEHFGIEPGC